MERHGWLRGDLSFLRGLLHEFNKERHFVEHRRLYPVTVTIPASEAGAGFGPSKPLADASLGKHLD